MSLPTRTTYRVATTLADFKACHAVLRANGIDEAERLQKPAVLAERDGQCLGFASSRYMHGRLTLGRIQLAGGKHKPWTAMRLFDAYERLLTVYGVTQYLVSVEADNTYLKWFAKLGLTQPPNAKLIQDHDGYHWYERYIGLHYGKPE